MNMNVLFLTLLSFESLQEHNIYSDLLRSSLRTDMSVCDLRARNERINQRIL